MGDFLFGESFFLKEHYRKTFIVCDSKKRSCVAGFGLRCLFVACSSSVLRPLFLRPAPLRVAGFGLRCLFAACSSSVLRTLFCGPPRFASRASDCAASSRRARPRCFAPFFAARPASRRGLRTVLPLRGVLVLGASHPFLRPAPLSFFSLPLFRQRKTPGTAFPPPRGLLIVAYFFTVFWAMPRIWEIVQPYSLQVTTLPQ